MWAWWFILNHLWPFLMETLGSGDDYGKVKHTVIWHLMTRISAEKCIVRQFCHCVNIIEYTYTNLDGIDYYTPKLYGLPPLYMRAIVHKNVVLWHMIIHVPSKSDRKCWNFSGLWPCRYMSLFDNVFSYFKGVNFN